MVQQPLVKRVEAIPLRSYAFLFFQISKTKGRKNSFSNLTEIRYVELWKNLE